MNARTNQLLNAEALLPGRKWLSTQPTFTIFLGYAGKIGRYMSILRVPTALVPSSQHYQTRVSGQVTVGELARYMAHVDTQVEVNTLEIARPARPEQRIDDLDIQGGDRFLIFTHQARPAELPTPIRPGDKIVQFTLGDTVISSREKKSLVVGRPEAAFIPDVDLRHFIAPNLLELVSADCLRLYFDPSAQVWYAARSGETLIMLDEIPLEATPIALNDAQWVRFYRPGDARPIGEMLVTLETVQAAENLALLPPGDETASLRIGLEKESQTLKVSGSIRAAQIVSSVAQYNRLPITVHASLYIARLVSPQTPLDMLRLGQSGLLYAALKLRYDQTVLVLRDVNRPARTYTLMAGQDERQIGCRSAAENPLPDLDIDLYDAIIGQGDDPRPFQGMSPYYARILYRAEEQSWWIRLDERSQVPLFVNSTRATRSASLPLISGDVVSIGPSLSHPYARLKVGEE
jgi:hypothetical protein